MFTSAKSNPNFATHKKYKQLRKSPINNADAASNLYENVEILMGDSRHERMF